MNLFLIIEGGLPGSFVVHNPFSRFSRRDESSRCLDKQWGMNPVGSKKEAKTEAWPVVNASLRLMAKVDKLRVTVEGPVDPHECRTVSASLAAILRSVNEFGSAGMSFPARG
ncbi:hypothetical protein [Pannonibacter sp.]|uniref:hypothetical protein n=1 Tax=Pannonibacter sp. TaxID=1906786 RepID=UPI003F6FF198